MKNKKKNKYMLLLLLLLGITIGFAALATTLKINGTATIGKNTWSVHWDNTDSKIVVTDGSVTTEKPTIGKELNNDPDYSQVSWSVTLNLPGDFYEFTVDAVNDGSVDAMITDIESKIGDDDIFEKENGTIVEVDPSPIPEYIDYTITYADDTPIALNHLLPKTTGRETYKVRVALNDKLNPGDLPQGENGVSYTFSFKIQYSQADENAIPVREPSDPELVNYTMNEMCPNCRFSDQYFNIGDEETTEYQMFNITDYENYGEEYFGYIVSNGIITRSFLCVNNDGDDNDKTVCLEGGNPSKYSRNVNILKHLYSECEEETDDYLKCWRYKTYADGSLLINGHYMELIDANGKLCDADDWDSKSCDD